MDSLAPFGITLARMNVTEIVSSIDAEITKLEQVRNVLTGTGNGARARKAAKPTPKKRKLSPDGRARIIAALKKRWAAKKKAQK